MDLLLEPLWDTPTLAKITGQAASTWEKRRLDGSGPQFVKLGRLVRYRPSDVQAWLDERTRRSTSDQGAIRDTPTRRLSQGKFHDPSAREIFQALGGKPVPGGYLVHCPVPSHGSGRGDQNPSLSVARPRREAPRPEDTAKDITAPTQDERAQGEAARIARRKLFGTRAALSERSRGIISRRAA